MKSILPGKKFQRNDEASRNSFKIKDTMNKIFERKSILRKR